MAVQCLILSSGLKDYGHLLALASYRKAPIGVEHAFCLTPTDEDSHSATIVVLCFAIMCVCAGRVHAGSGQGRGADSAQGLSFSVFLLAGVDTICGPPHRMLLVETVPVVLQKGRKAPSRHAFQLLLLLIYSA